jgi:hypothetical protein
MWQVRKRIRNETVMLRGNEKGGKQIEKVRKKETKTNARGRHDS